MTASRTKYNVEYFTEAIYFAENITRKLTKDEIKDKLESIKMLEDLPKLPRDEESKQLKIYKEANEVYKTLYIAVARAIMFILESNLLGIYDKAESYNYAPPQEPIIAVEAIKLLPNAFIGGPIKSAINSNNPFVQKIAIEYFETLPSDIRISEIFPKDYNLMIKKLKPIVFQKLKEMGRG